MPSVLHAPHIWSTYQWCNYEHKHLTQIQALYTIFVWICLPSSSAHNVAHAFNRLNKSELIRIYTFLNSSCSKSYLVSVQLHCSSWCHCSQYLCFHPRSWVPSIKKPRVLAVCSYVEVTILCIHLQPEIWAHIICAFLLLPHACNRPSIDLNLPQLTRNGTRSSTYTIIIKMTIHWRQLQYEVSNKLSLSIEQTIYKEKEMQKAGGVKYLAYKEMEPRIKLHNPKESIPKWAKSASIEVPILDSRAEYYCGTRIHSFSIKVVKRSK